MWWHAVWRSHDGVRVAPPVFECLNRGQVSPADRKCVGVSGIRFIPLRSWDFFGVVDRAHAESLGSRLLIRCELLAAVLDEVYMPLHRRNAALEEPLIAKTFARALQKKPACVQLSLDSADDS